MLCRSNVSHIKFDVRSVTLSLQDVSLSTLYERYLSQNLLKDIELIVIYGSSSTV